MGLTIAERRRRLVAGGAIPILFAATFASEGNPSGIVQPLVSPPIIQSRPHANFFSFASGVLNTDNYSNIDSLAGQGFTGVVPSTVSGPTVWTKANAGFSPVSVNNEWGGGSAFIVSGVTSILCVNIRVVNILQQINGGATLAAGNNTRSFGSPLTTGNTVVIATQFVGDASMNIGNVTDTNGNVYSPLGVCRAQFNAVPPNQTQHLFLHLCRGVVGGTPTITIPISGGTVDSGVPWLAEFQLRS